MTGKPKNDVWTVQFRCKVSSDKVELKFDTLIRGFKGSWVKDAKFLVLAYRISNKSDIPPSRRGVSGNRSVFDEGFFAVEPTANGGTKRVGIQVDSEEEAAGQFAAYVTYEKFDDSLDHDPTLGLDNTDSFWITISVVLGIGFVGVLCVTACLFVVIGFVVFRNKSQKGFNNI